MKFLVMLRNPEAWQRCMRIYKRKSDSGRQRPRVGNVKPMRCVPNWRPATGAAPSRHRGSVRKGPVVLLAFRLACSWTNLNGRARPRRLKSSGCRGRRRKYPGEQWMARLGPAMVRSCSKDAALLNGSARRSTTAIAKARGLRGSCVTANARTALRPAPAPGFPWEPGHLQAGQGHLPEPGLERVGRRVPRVVLQAPHQGQPLAPRREHRVRISRLAAVTDYT